jgi:hypothetical protein
MTNSPSTFPEDDAAADVELRLCELLRQNRIPFSKPNPHQLKVGPWSYYSSTGTILRDGQSKEKDRGPEAFINTLKRAYPNRRLEWPTTIEL